MNFPIVAVGYVRCSTDMQEDSPDQQKHEITRFAEENGYQIASWYVDFGASGTTFSDRLEFKRLVRDVEQGPSFSTVICYDESRWGRAIDSEENTYWRVYFRKHRVDVVLVRTSVDPNNDFAPMLSAFEGVQASQYSKKLSELTLRGQLNNKGHSNGGTAPYGYKRVAVNRRTGEKRELPAGARSIKGEEKVVVEPGAQDEVENVKKIFLLRSEGLSYTAIAKKLNSMHVPCPKRGRWRNRDQKWSSNTIRGILQNPVYFGAWVYNRISNSKIQASQKRKGGGGETKYPHFQNAKKEWAIQEDAYQPIISKALWEKANSIYQAPAKTSKPRYEIPYILRGLVVCKRCGFHYQGQSTRAKGKNYFRYVCGGHNSKGICQYFAVNKDALEKFVLKCIEETLLTPDFVSLLQAAFRTLTKAQPSLNRKEAARLSTAISECEKKTGHLTLALEQGGGIVSIIDRLKELANEKEHLSKQLMELKTTSKNHQNENLEGLVTDFVSAFESRFLQGGVTEKRELLRKCIVRVEIDPENREVECIVRKLPLVIPALAELQERIAKSETATRLESPFRRVGVAGTGLEPATFGL